jgi:hypothetical protein
MPKLTTWSITGLRPSVTKAWRMWLSMGSRIPAMAATCPDRPATTIATFFARIAPRVVCTPVTRPFSMSIPVTSQFWIRSTPRWSAARA